MKVIGTSPLLSVVSNYFSPDGDTASNLGLGITISGGYLYANYTGGTTSPAIGVWKIGAGCTLTFVRHLVTGGLNGGISDGMAVTPTGNSWRPPYGDGSVGSYATGAGNTLLSPRRSPQETPSEGEPIPEVLRSLRTELGQSLEISLVRTLPNSTSRKLAPMGYWLRLLRMVELEALVLGWTATASSLARTTSSSMSSIVIPDSKPLSRLTPLPG